MSKGLLATILKIIVICVNIVAALALVIFASLFVTSPKTANNLASSCISCKKPNITLARQPIFRSRGRMTVKDWEVMLSPSSTEPVIVPELKPSEQQRMALARVNHYRALVGLAPVTLNKDINRASESHAEYNARHSLSGHTEKRSKDGYSGAWPWDRMECFGYDKFTYATEICSTRWAEPQFLLSINPNWAVDGWVDTVYHRFPILSPDVYEAGFGARRTVTCVSYVMDFGNPGFADKKTIVCYPVKDQHDVPVEFTGDEKPDPLPGRSYPVGYPITVTFNDYRDIVITSVALTNEYGESVESYYITPFSNEYIRESLAILPKKPLSYGATYSVCVLGVADEEPVNLTWQFTTTKQSRNAIP